MARLIINKCVIPENAKTEIFHTPIYENDIFVSGGKGLMWSEDGITWTKGTSTTITNINDINWETPIYANNIFVVYGKQGTTNYLGWSENGKTWALGTGAISNATGPPIYANALFLCGATTAPIRSTNGKDWVAGTGGIPNSSVHTPIFANNIYVAGTSGNGLMWSENGQAWTAGTGITTGDYDKIIYAKNVFVSAISNTETTTTTSLIYSNDGKAWTAGTGVGTDKKWEYITFLNNIFIGSTTNAGMYWSENGIAWTACTGIGESGNWNKAIFHNGIFANNTNSFSVNTTSKFGWSIDGKEWFESTTNSTGAVETDAKWTNLMQNANILVCGSSNGRGYAWSYDGKNYKTAIGDLIFYNPNIEKIAFTPMYIEISNTMQKIFVGGSNYGLYYLTFNGNEYQKLQDIMIDEKTDWATFVNANGNENPPNPKFEYKVLGAMNWNRVAGLINDGYYTTKEYSGEVEYQQAEIVKQTSGTSTIYYISQVNENINHPLTDANYWATLDTTNRAEYATYASLVGQWQNDYGALNAISENFKYMGEFDSATTYYRSNLVKYNNRAYVCIADEVAGGSNSNPSTDTQSWLKIQLGLPVELDPPTDMIKGDVYFKASVPPIPPTPFIITNKLNGSQINDSPHGDLTYTYTFSGGTPTKAVIKSNGTIVATLEQGATLSYRMHTATWGGVLVYIEFNLDGTITMHTHGNDYANRGTYNIEITFYKNETDYDSDTFSFKSYVSCLKKGTLVTLGDGSYKKIEDITYEDNLRVWDFDNGEFSNAKPLFILKGYSPNYNIIKFENGTELYTIRQHRIFNKEFGKFTYPMTEDTPIGTTTFMDNGTYTKVISKELVETPCEYYNIITDKHINLFGNKILTSCRLSNIYPIKDMKYYKNEFTLRTNEDLTMFPITIINGLRLREQPMWEEVSSNAENHGNSLVEYVQNLINKKVNIMVPE